MKKIIIILSMILLIQKVSYAQNNIDQLLELGIANAQRFGKDYFTPAGEALVNNMSNGWYKTAKVKKLWYFDIGIVGNLSFIRDEKQSFILNVTEYDGVFFQDGSPSKVIATAFGENPAETTLVLDQGAGAPVIVALPDGIGGMSTGMIPSGFLQASMGISRSTEIKFRGLPTTKVRDNATIGLYGVGLQHEFTDWIFAWKRLPFRVSAIVGYTRVKGMYNFESSEQITAEGQEIRLRSNSWLVSAIMSTKLPKLNFYGGFGFYTGSNTADVLGRYTVQNGPLASQAVVDPISIKNTTNGVKATFGSSMKISFFRVNLDYTLQNYNNLSFGVDFVW